jgi:hypothetical protein
MIERECLVEPLPEKLPRRAYSHYDVGGLRVGTKDGGGGIKTEYPEYAKLESGGNNQNERGKIEDPHAVASSPIELATCNVS